MFAGFLFWWFDLSTWMQFFPRFFGGIKWFHNPVKDLLQFYNSISKLTTALYYLPSSLVASSTLAFATNHQHLSKLCQPFSVHYQFDHHMHRPLSKVRRPIHYHLRQRESRVHGHSPFIITPSASLTASPWPLPSLPYRRPPSTHTASDLRLLPKKRKIGRSAAIRQTKRYSRRSKFD